MHTLRGAEIGELLDALPSLVAYVDRERHCLYANRATRFWFGHDPGEVVGKALPELLGEETDAVFAPHVRDALRGTHVSFERTMVLPRGDVAHAFVELLPHFRGQEPDGFTLLVTNITRQAQAEAARAEGQRRVEELAQRSQTAAGHTDDVLQELFAISLHLDRMRRAPDRAPAVADDVIESMSNTIETLRATVKQLAASG